MANPDTVESPVVNIQPADVQMVDTPRADVDGTEFPSATVATRGIH